VYILRTGNLKEKIYIFRENLHLCGGEVLVIRHNSWGKCFPERDSVPGRIPGPVPRAESVPASPLGDLFGNAYRNLHPAAKHQDEIVPPLKPCPVPVTNLVPRNEEASDRSPNTSGPITSIPCYTPTGYGLGLDSSGVGAPVLHRSNRPCSRLISPVYQ
jgi:hypothetical protein